MTSAAAELERATTAGGEAPASACPFCAARGVGNLCLDCGRDKTAPRRVCAKCNANTPLADSVCQACGHRKVSDLRWKVPVIVAMFLAALVLATILHMA